MSKDLGLVLEALNQLRQNSHNLIIKQSLTFFSIITYAKCFTSNKGRGTKLESKHVFKESLNHLIAEHNRILDLRMEYVAHAGSAYDKCAVIGTLITDNPIFTLAMDLNSNLRYVSSIEHNMDIFIELCEYLKNHLQIKTDFFQQKIFEDFRKSPPDELLNQAIHPSITNLYSLKPRKTHGGFEVLAFELIKTS
jgi:hypothetical protein